MKTFKKLLFIAILLILLCAYIISFKYFGNKEITKVNSPVSTILTNRPRLEDDFYGYVNYEYLSNNQLDDDKIQNYAINKTDKIEEKRDIIIDELLLSDTPIGNKINNLYKSYMNSTEEESLAELNKYIDKMNSSSNIEEFVKNSIDVNYELSTDILFSPYVYLNLKGESKKYFALMPITYDWYNIEGRYYTLPDFKSIVRMYKKYDIMLLKQYGYSAKEAIEIAEKIQSMYEEIARFSEPDSESLIDNGYKIYNIDELQLSLKNISLNTITKNYKEFYDGNNVLVADINQLKQIDNYLKEENLDTLKKYAMLKILTCYAEYISDDYYKICSDCMYEMTPVTEMKKEEKTKEEIGHEQIYYFFKDTVTKEFANKHFTKEQKEFYTNLIKEEIENYKLRIKNENWLTDETKQKALAKMENMAYTVGVPENFVIVENNYKIDGNNSYIKNIIDMNHNLRLEEMRQIKKGNILYNNSELDCLTFNACYISINNSINLLLGYIYSLTEALNLGQTNLEDNYYKILGSIGAIIGHELSHALDTTGCKYDEYGNYINWWNKEDEYNFNKLTSKVVKYYDNYDQYGDTTLGENIADLGGVSIIVQIAENRLATDEDYKELFESYAKIWASQSTSIVKEYLLKNDMHSIDKNRVNAVLSSIDKFYTVYKIKEADKMYVLPEYRVSVW